LKEKDYKVFFISNGSYAVIFYVRVRICMLKKAGLPPDIAVAIPALREHLGELLESQAFKGSRRSRQFLQHVVEKALTGQADELKERCLGVALFGRAPSYDTGDDAIVRVTASDVRKRLQHYYAETDSPIRVELVAGSYTPEFRSLPGRDPVLPAPAPVPVLEPRPSRRWRWAALAVAFLAAVAIPAIWLWNRHRAAESLTPRDVLPWSVLLQDGHQLQLVLADPDISAMQELTASQISLPDYANRRYPANPEAFGSDMQKALRLLRGVNVAAVDVQIALAFSRLAASSSAKLKVNTARSLQLSAFGTDDDFIILGSSRSNPWGTLFQDQLDFDFVREPELNREIVRNRRVQPGELLRYVPTAGGFDTGHSFAIIAMVGNPNQAGKVLLVAGANAEGTQAAGQFLTNIAELARTLQAHGIDPGGAPCHFEILLQVRTLAGSPSAIEVVACHRLPARASS
jgi:hypothetical protein